MLLRWMRRKVSMALLLIMALAVAACGGSGGAGGEGGANSGDGDTASAQAPSAGQVKTETKSAGDGEDEGTLTVYLNDFDEIIAEMFKEATGYDVELVTGNGAEIMSRIQAEKGNPHWDVVWIDAMPSIHGLALDGQLLEGWTPENAANLKESFRRHVPENGAYYPTGAHAAGLIVYNKNALNPEQAPQSWDDFADPSFKGEIGMADPAIAAPAFPYVAWFFEERGMDGGKAYFETLFANGLRVYPKNPNVVTALSSGEVKAAALQESNAYQMRENGEPIEIIWPEEGAPASVRVAAIQKDTKNPNAAKAFVEFLLSRETQQALIDQGEEAYFEPSVEGAQPKPDRNPDAKLVAADAAWAAAHEAEIKQWFADKAVQ